MFRGRHPPADGGRFNYALRRLIAELVPVAERAYVEAPNKDSDVDDFLRCAAVGFVSDGNYAEALRLARLAIERDSQDKAFYAAAGLAAFSLGDFDQAETYLKKGQGEKFGVTFLGKPVPLGDAFSKLAADCLQNIPDYQTAWQREQQLRVAEAKAGDLPHVLLKTGAGEIEVELFAREAPKTVAHFLALVESGCYNRNAENARLEQITTLSKKDPGDGRLRSIDDKEREIPSEANAPQRRIHFPGSLSMVSDSPNFCGPRVAVAMVPAKYLDGANTVFGRVVKGMDSLARLQQSDIQTWCCGETGASGRDPEGILEAKVLEKVPGNAK